MATAASASRSLLRSTRAWLVGLLVTVPGAVALAAWAGPPPGGPGMLGLPLQGRMMDRWLDKVDASTEQRAQIRQIAESAAADVKSQFESGKSVRDQALSLFTQPTVDANAAESLRQQMLAQQDQASRRMLQAMIEVSRVLTPEQRKTLADELSKRREMAERHHRERRLSDAAPTR